ncbi:SDR family NAD(P)-dependent oxidoreductase [Pseudorhodoplanes sp.]|uniref:SDR family NAD(P)-dependent oxidoreductase n=1 Tax=Pseudorhodoplanes sp. TaxID=1934341 RepID=UPI002D00E88D|nr:SDR family oxidoreductase [Pseudorhodoplanes sp.]HWV51486.1 SDR family oxidoreductase [Pseudorhodoplanes sp.]
MSSELKPLAGRVAIVTGSGRNIGRAIAISFAAAGARVVINGHRDQSALDAVVNEIRSNGGEAIACLADVSRDDEIACMVALAKETYGHVDIAVSNVGKRPYAAFLDITPEDWDDVLRTNLSAPFYLARHTIPMMRERRFGRIINISGFSGFFAHVTHRAHSVSAKLGLHGLSKAIAREFGPDGITANTVAPGMIDTARDWSQYKHIDTEKLSAEIPVRRLGTPDDIAEACLFLAGEGGGFVSGQVIHVNGGQMMI